MSTTTPTISCDVKNFELADLGKKRIEWANQSMKVLQIIRKEFIKNQPLKGVRVSACLHVTAETANLMIALRDGADLVSVLHTKRTAELGNVIGGTEETTTGVIRLRAMAKEGVLRYPIVAVN